MAHASRMSQEEKRDANKTDRIDLTIYMATTPKENLPKGVANRWSADLMPPGSKEETDLRNFMENPAKNKFVLFFKSEKEAINYARAMDLLLGRSGVLSNVVITVSEKSARDEEEYTLAPGQEYKISISAEERERVPPLKRREEIILGKFKGAGESLQAVVPAKKSPDEDFLAQAEGALNSNDPLFGANETQEDLGGVTPTKAERGVARITPLPLKFKDRDGDMRALIPDAETRKEVEEARKNGTEYTLTLLGNSRLDAFLAAHGNERVEVKELGNRKFEVTINKMSEVEKRMRGV